MSKSIVLILGLSLLLLALFFWYPFSSSSNIYDEKPADVSSIPQLSSDTVVDFFGNTYPTVRIGNQVWLAENVKTTQFNCGDSLKVKFTNGLEKGPNVEFYDNQPRYAYYLNNKNFGFGAIYSFSTITKCDICPTGFRVPTKADWEVLIDYLGGINHVGNRLLKNGDSGFNALLAGRLDSYGSNYHDNFEFWWSQDFIPQSGQKLAYVFEVDQQGVSKLIGQDVRTGNYVRCVKNL